MKEGLIIMFLVLGLMMSTTVLAAESISDALNGVFNQILEWGSLKFLGISGVGDNQLIAFIRIALGVLLFALLYFGLSMIPGLGEQKPIKITIAVILSIITAVFLPATILATFGGTYAAIFALIIIGAPLAGVAWLIFATSTPNRFVAALKFFGVCFCIWLVNEISYLGNKLAGTSSLIDFSYFISKFSLWANIFLWLVLMYYIIMFIKGEEGDEITESVGEKAKKAWEWGTDKLSSLREKTSKAEKFELKEYVDLTELKKDVENAKDNQSLVKKVGSDKRRAKRDERRVFRLINYLKNTAKEVELSVEEKKEVEDIIDKIDLFNKTVIEKIKEFETTLKEEINPIDEARSPAKFKAKQSKLVKILNEAITAEEDLSLEFKGLKKILGK